MRGNRPPVVLPMNVSDVAVALALTTLALGELSIDGQTLFGALALSLLMTLPLAARSKYPLSVGLVTISAFGLQALVLDPVPQVLGNGLAVLVATYTAAARTGPRRALPLVVLAMAAFTGFEAARDDIAAAVGDMAFVVPAWGLGWVAWHRRRTVRSQIAAAEERVRTAEEVSELALADERKRIARELHDVVSHAVTVVVLQARGGRSLLDSDPEQARSALDAIEVAGLEALAEMRRLVTLLREPGPGTAPQPGLADIEALVYAARETGTAVELTVTRQPRGMGAGAELTAFRLVQESLTNALRHAPGAPITIVIEQSGTFTTITVSNPLSASPSEADRGRASSGLGLIGMGERVALYGGHLDYGRVCGDPGTDRWEVVGTLPLPSSIAQGTSSHSASALVGTRPDAS